MDEQKTPIRPIKCMEVDDQLPKEVLEGVKPAAYLVRITMEPVKAVPIPGGHRYAAYSHAIPGYPSLEWAELERDLVLAVERKDEPGIRRELCRILGKHTLANRTFLKGFIKRVVKK